MHKNWKLIVLRWVNCLFEPSLKSIHDLKDGKVLSSLPVISSSSKECAFAQLLKYFESHYPKYGASLCDPRSECWSDEEELYALATLLLFHASVHEPVGSLQNNASNNLDQPTQLSVVQFLQKAMNLGCNLSKEALLSCIPHSPDNVNASPLSPGLPLHSSVQANTPLADFLSSPVARQKMRPSKDRLHGRIIELEAQLESEEIKKMELKEEFEFKIAKLEKKLSEKCTEAQILRESLELTEEAEEAHSEAHANNRGKTRKLCEEVKELNQYVQRLLGDAEELNNAKDILQRKLSCAERKAAHWESSAFTLDESSKVLKMKVEEQTHEIESLLERCANLEAMRSQENTPTRLSSRSAGLGTFFSPPFAPENLGDIVEQKLITKEKENEELINDIKALEDQLRAIQISHDDLQEKLSKEKYSAVRLQSKYESRLEELTKSFENISKEHEVCLHEKEQVLFSLKESQSRSEVFSNLLKDATASRDAAELEVLSLKEAMHALEVKVALLSTQLHIAEEKQGESEQAMMSRSTQFVSLQQEQDKLSSQLRSAVKDRDKIESTLNEVVKKRDFLQSSVYALDAAKEDLLEQVSLLKEHSGNLAQQVKELESSRKVEEDKLLTLLTEKERISSCLESVQNEKEKSIVSLNVLTEQNNAANADILRLTAEKVHRDAELQNVIHQRDKALLDVAEVLAEKETIQNLLQSTVTENEKLLCQINILSQQEGDLESIIKNKEKMLKSFERQLSVADEEKEKLHLALKSSASQLSEAVQEKKSLSVELLNKIQDLQHSFQMQCAQKETLQSEWAAAQKCYSASVAEMSEKLHLSETEIACLNGKLEDALQQCEDQKNKIDDLISEKSDIEADLSDSLSRFMAAQDNNSFFKKEIECLTQKLCNASRDNELLQTEIENLRSQNKNLASEKDLLHLKVQDICRERDEKTSLMEDLLKIKSDLSSRLALFETDNLELNNKVSQLSAQVDTDVKKQEILEEESACRVSALEEECDIKSQQLVIVQHELSEMESSLATLMVEKEKNVNESNLLKSKLHSLENELANSVSRCEVITVEKDNMFVELSRVQKEKEEALAWVEAVESEKKTISSSLEAERTLKDEAISCLKRSETLLAEFQASSSYQETKVITLTQEIFQLQEQRKELTLQVEALQIEKDELSNFLELLKKDAIEKESKMTIVPNKSQIKECEMEIKMRELEEVCKTLKGEVALKDNKIDVISEQLRALSEERRTHVEAIQSCERKNHEVKELVEETNCREENQILKHQSYNAPQYDLSSKKSVLAEENLTTFKSEDEFNAALRLKAKEVDQIISDHGKLMFTLLNEVKMVAEGDDCTDGESLHNVQNISAVVLQGVRNLRRELEEERKKVSSMRVELSAEGKVIEQRPCNESLHRMSFHGQDKLAQLEQDERLWQLERAKNQLEFRLDGMMTQKRDVEEHLSQLRIVLEDVATVCENLYSALPSSCDAVHEVTNMKKEVEKKLRAVDKKYADSLCGIIESAYNILKWSEKQTKVTSSSGESTDLTEFFSEKDGIESRVTVVCGVMASLTSDVRAAINSCRFLSERCESYLRAQTRESLQIKTSITKKDDLHISPTGSAQVEEGSVSTSSEKLIGERFSGASSLEEDYILLKHTNADLEKQLSSLQTQLDEWRTLEDSDSVRAKLQAKVNALMLRPTQEQMEEKIKEVRLQFAAKLDNMKAKMKEIVNEEVKKVDKERSNSEREIIAKYNTQIIGFEEHIQRLSSQLWELGEKLLQEEQDRKDAQSQLSALKERQKRLLNMRRENSLSLDRFDVFFEDTVKSNNRRQSSVDRFVFPKAVNNQGTQTRQLKTRSNSLSSISKDTSVDDNASRHHNTVMAPASMGLAFPEEDEDGEVFNNDYLTELKEGRCRPVGDNRRVSELQYRNSLCPPHLKSSYPLETQFHDPKVYKEEELKGQDEKQRRPGKDRGATLYNKPGPPTPSRKAGRYSLQGKDDLTPRAILREHNESQTSYGSGMLRVAKTTPSRLRALFTSSKVANASNFPAHKKSENSTPGTPSKRLSIFRKRFGSSKENQSVASGYSSLR